MVRVLVSALSPMFESFTVHRMSLPTDPTPARVLVADDQPDVLEALRWLLTGEGYLPQFVSSTDAVMERAIAVFDTAVAGLGGCPYAKGASGNVGTEDVIYLMNGLGIEHGVDLDAVARAGREICAALGREPASKVAQALKAKAA